MSDDPNSIPSPNTMPPQNYVQQLASALGLNSTVPTTDFESLIELNRRQQQQQLNMSNVGEVRREEEGKKCARVRKEKGSKQLKCLD